MVAVSEFCNRNGQVWHHRLVGINRASPTGLPRPQERVPLVESRQNRYYRTVCCFAIDGAIISMLLSR